MKDMRLLLVLASALAVVASASAAIPAKPVHASMSTTSTMPLVDTPWRYTIVVKDQAADHNFLLTGPGVDKKTSVGAKTTATWTLTLKKGTYKFVCDPHASFMKGSFTVK